MYHRAVPAWLAAATVTAATNARKIAAFVTDPAAAQLGSGNRHWIGKPGAAATRWPKSVTCSPPTLPTGRNRAQRLQRPRSNGPRQPVPKRSSRRLGKRVMPFGSASKPTIP